MLRSLAHRRAHARGELAGMCFKSVDVKCRKALTAKSAKSADLNGVKKNDKMSYFNLKKSAESADFKLFNVDEFG